MAVARRTSQFLATLLTLLLLTACIRSPWGEPPAFDRLAGRVPGDVETATFLNLKPDGEAGRHWERVRRRIEADPAGQDALGSIYHPFRVEEYGLDEFVAGPAVQSTMQAGNWAILVLSDAAGAREALLGRSAAGPWEEEEYQGAALYRGRIRPSGDSRNYEVAWAIEDELLFLVDSLQGDPTGHLKKLLSLAEADSLASVPAWRTLRERLPENPMGLIFINVGEQARRYPPPSGDTSPQAALDRQILGLALAAVPEAEGMRVEIAGEVVLQSDAPVELHDLFNLPAVQPGGWPGLPADSAAVLVAHDASTVWPWLGQSFNLNGLAYLRDSLGLDVQADLAGEGGPLAGDFALAVTPPLPGQPVSGDFPAMQLLILGRDVPEEKAAGLRAAMEGRGATFGSQEVEGVALHTQVGTAASGYAIAYGADGDTFLFGTSPEAVGRAVAAQREGRGLAAAPAFRAVLSRLPEKPAFLFYLNIEALLDLLRTNTTEEQNQSLSEYRLLEAFEAIGLGVRLAPDRFDGVLYFLVGE
jgi:hypothetical protein